VIVAPDLEATLSEAKDLSSGSSYEMIRGANALFSLNNQILGVEEVQTCLIFVR